MPAPVPPIYHVLEGKAQGVAIGLFAGAGNSEGGYAELKGASIGGLASTINGELKGFQYGSVVSQTEDCSGANLSGIAAIVYGDLKGINAGGIGSFVENDCKGVSAGVFTSWIDGELEGASISAGYNKTLRNGKIAIQIGLINTITDYNNNGLVIQIGLYNRAENRTIPLINIRGLSRLFKKKSSDVLVKNFSSPKGKK